MVGFRDFIEYLDPFFKSLKSLIECLRLLPIKLLMSSASVDTRTQLKNNDQDIDQLEFVEKLTFTMLFKQRKTELLSQKENILAQQLLKVI